jgi:hypothetical protein
MLSIFYAVAAAAVCLNLTICIAWKIGRRFEAPGVSWLESAAAGSLLHILLVNLRFSSSHRLPRDLFTSFLQSRLIGHIHVAGLVMALALLSNNPRTQVALALLFLPLTSFFVSRACLNLISFLIPQIVAATPRSQASHRLLMVGLYQPVVGIVI